LLAVAFVALGIAGCSDDDDDSATPTPSVCEQADTLEQSVEDLTSLDVIASGTDGLTAAVDQVRTDAEALKQTASDAIAPEVDALTTAIDDARETVSSLDSDASLSSRIAEIESALEGIATAADNLKDALDQECQ
jgi:DNA repair ATPase RecN